MTKPLRFGLALLAGALAGGSARCACAQEAPGHTDAGAPAAVKVAARKNPGDLPYLFFSHDQALLQSLLPPRPRKVEVLYRISFTELPEPKQDAYVPQGWAVALVGNGWEQTVPIARGGYFALPALPVGRQGATLMFKEQSRPHFLNVAWVVGVEAGRRLSYADFGRAMQEVHDAQDQISPDYHPLDTERIARYDGLKACFLDAGGKLLIDGEPAADATVGDCAILRFDPAKAAGGHVIEFAGPLQIVTVVETAPYLGPKG